MKQRSLFRFVLTLVGVGAITLAAIPAQAGIARGSFHQTNLVSDILGRAQTFDKDLKNPWGLSSSPTSPMWVSDNNAGVSTLYNGAGQKVPLTVTIPAPDRGPGGTPTGTVFNPTPDFVVTQGTKSGPARFLFDTEDGTVLGWNPGVNATSAII